uniref:Uncharacterized protein n=1 Tax=Peronospora matthiolae TaxID=2874970 RepID=A0AAV1TT16_9STRA
MIKRFLLFVLLLSPGAISDAFLALTASTVPDGTIPVQKLATNSKARGKQALKPSEDMTAAVGEERAPDFFPGLEEHLKAASEKMHDWIGWMARKSAFWEKAESAPTGEGEALSKVDEVLPEEEAVRKVDKALQKVNDV